MERIKDDINPKKIRCKNCGKILDGLDFSNWDPKDGFCVDCMLKLGTIGLGDLYPPIH